MINLNAMKNVGGVPLILKLLIDRHAVQKTDLQFDMFQGLTLWKAKPIKSSTIHNQIATKNSFEYAKFDTSFYSCVVTQVTKNAQS